LMNLYWTSALVGRLMVPFHSGLASVYSSAARATASFVLQEPSLGFKRRGSGSPIGPVGSYNSYELLCLLPTVIRPIAVHTYMLELFITL
jgi:hypothetical protein